MNEQGPRTHGSHIKRQIGSKSWICCVLYFSFFFFLLNYICAWQGGLF